MSMAAASAIAYAALRELMHPQSHRVSADEYKEAMDLISAHIAIVVPIFGASALGEPLREIPREVIVQGHFRWGGLRLEFDSGREPYVDLAIRKAALDPILDRLRLAYAPMSGRQASPGAGRNIQSLLAKARS
jgi:hypothetical protein